MGIRQNLETKYVTTGNNQSNKPERSCRCTSTGSDRVFIQMLRTAPHPMLLYERKQKGKSKEEGREKENKNIIRGYSAAAMPSATSVMNYLFQNDVFLSSATHFVQISNIFLTVIRKKSYPLLTLWQGTPVPDLQLQRTLSWHHSS